MGLLGLTKIISGGQTGSDQGGLAAAVFVGLPTGGWAPAGFRTEAGLCPWLAEYGLQETAQSTYPPRTKLNVEQSHATLLFGSQKSPGSLLTRDLAQEAGRPLLSVPWSSGDETPDSGILVRWLREMEKVGRPVRVLNIAGPRESGCPGAADATFLFVVRALLSR